MPIKILSAQLANQIAAGEVVERPASVVKELVENSLDAGATKIELEIEGGGSRLIKVRDNGVGIAQAELALALSRHATSKISDLSDLDKIMSLGFRGEALASISSVARLTLTSCTADQNCAYAASAEGREMTVEVRAAAHPQGTTVEVADLFFNTPARRRFLRTEKTEFSHIDEVIRRIALSCFNIQFRLSHNGQLVRQYMPASDSQAQDKRIKAICGAHFLQNSLKINASYDGLELSGWLGSRRAARNQADLQYTYVNGRMMRDKLLNHAIRQAFSDKLANEQYPAFVLYLTLDPSQVDVNVHPAKHEVRFHQARMVHDYVYRVLAETLEQDDIQVAAQNEYAQPSIADTVDMANTKDRETSPDLVNDQVSCYKHPPQKASNEYQKSKAEQVPESRPVHAISTLFPGQKHLTGVSAARAKTGQTDTQAQSSHLYGQLIKPSSVLPQAKQTGYNSNTASDKDWLYLTLVQEKWLLFNYQGHLHATAALPCCEFLAKNKLSRSLATGIVSQPLLLPVAISVENAEIELLKTHRDQFEALGFAVKISPSNKLVVQKIPAVVKDFQINSIIFKLLRKISEQNEQLNSHNWLNALSQAVAPELITQPQHFSLWLNDVSEQAESQLQTYLQQNSVKMDLNQWLDS
ncbi:DNA mismatch repair endonuclease MutL [Gayadomonas joobiniege]|uniref:DNA mismatch repair endonuclease MutL n=1 Tax=Gayadomonas joobiniege TaxID=1234606 RepID=UPI00037FD49B|nr:DNA mismatch repair endonuclease MutL [Gayadomonas joobiniege]